MSIFHDDMIVNDLFRRSTQMATAMAIKARSWQPAEYATFLSSLVGKKGSLHPDTVRTIQAPLAGIPDPLARQVCVDAVAKLGPLDHNALRESYLLSGDFEAAASLLPALPEFGPDDADALLKAHGDAELCDGIAAGLLVSERAWCRAFEWAVAHDYDQAVRLWKARRSAVPSQAIAAEFAAQVGRHQNLEALFELSRVCDLPVTRSLAAAVLNGLSKSPLDDVVAALRLLDGIATVQDAEHAGEVLARHAAAVLQMNLSPLLGNALLAGLYRCNSSQTVFHVYRYMRRERGFEPNGDTFQVLANAAYRLGNSKLTSWYLWQEAVATGPPSRKLAETVLFCQLIGPSFRTVFFYLHEMKKYNIYLRPHVQRRLYNKFESVQDGALVALFSDMGRLGEHARFDLNLATLESRPYERQAERNAQVFLAGLRPAEPPLAVLADMLAFDSAAKRP